MHKFDIVILGFGIGGYSAYKKLKKTDKKILIIDKNNYYTFTPMLHEVASGSVDPDHCSKSIRSIIKKTPHKFIKATVTNIDPKQNKISTDRGCFYFKKCIVALGSKVNHFQVKGAKEFSHHVRTLKAAKNLHHTFVNKLESHAKKTAYNKHCRCWCNWSRNCRAIWRFSAKRTKKLLP